MKNFVIKLSLFCCISALVVYGTGELLYMIISNTGQNILSDSDFKVTEAVCRSRKHIKTKKLVLGDSVGNSLYGENTDSCVYSLTASVAITASGQYCLLAKFFNNNSEHLPEEVILIVNPLCWNNILDGGLSYSLFAKQFYNDEFIDYLDETEKKEISNWPYSFLLNAHWFRICPYSTDVKGHGERGKWISEMQYRYIKKMDALCKSKGIQFKLLSGPVRSSLHDEVEKISCADEKAAEPLFAQYFKSIKYMDDSNFVDQLHLKHSKVPTDYFKLYE